MVSTSTRRKAFGAGSMGRVRSACATVRTVAPLAAFSTSFGTDAGEFVSRKPCFWPRLKFASMATLARAPICRWTPKLAVHARSFSRVGEISWMERIGSTVSEGSDGMAFG